MYLSTAIIHNTVIIISQFHQVSEFFPVDKNCEASNTNLNQILNLTVISLKVVDCSIRVFESGLQINWLAIVKIISGHFPWLWSTAKAKIIMSQM